MKDTLEKLLQGIEQRRQALLNEDSEYDLHQLRVSVRQLRSLLKFEEHPVAWQLRLEWGYLVSHTNPARDWDTLAERLDKLPQDQQAVALIEAVEGRRRQIWKDMQRALRNQAWDDTSTGMVAYLDSAFDDQRAPPSPELQIAEARARVDAAWSRAQRDGDNRSWHKLRTAIKDLRYILESFPLGTVDEPVALCERIQDHLGCWHDSLMHRHLLREVDKDMPSEERSAREAIARLDTELFAESMRCLKETRHVMAARNQLLERHSSSKQD